MFGDMLGKFQEMKQKMDEAKARLDNVSFKEEMEGGKIAVVMTANREVKSITVSEELLRGDKEELEELLVVVLNRAIVKAGDIHEREMQGAASGFLPNIPGLM